MAKLNMKKVLIIRFSSIGDIILTTPVIRCLKEQTDYEIHYVTKKPFAFLLINNPYVDVIHNIEESINEVADELSTIGFDLVIDLHNNIRSSMLKKKLGVKTKTVNKLNVRKWIFVNLKWNVMPDIHIVDRYLDTVAHLGVKNDNQGLDYFLPAEVSETRLPETHQNGYIAFGIGGQYEGKRMPAEKIITLLNKIEHPVVLLGGMEDELAANQIVEAVGTSVISQCGKLSMDESAFLVKESRLVVSNDTAIMHIAAAYNKNVISLWGQTVPEFGMYPYMPGKNSLMVEPEAGGRPISKLGNRKQSNHIMLKINEQLIVDHIAKHY